MSADVYWQEMLARCAKSWVLEVRGCAWAELRVNGESLVIVHGLPAITALTLAHEAVTSLPALIAELRAARAEIEQLRVQLAGCSVAALGYSEGPSRAKPGDYGWSQSYEDVANIRNELRAARECARLLKIALPRLIHTEIVFQAMCLEACEAHKKATKGDG